MTFTLEDVEKFGLERGVNKVAGFIQNLLLSKSSGKVVVLVAGGSCSGKTSKVAMKIKKVFGDRAILLSADNYYKGIDFMEEEKRNGNEISWDQPEAVDLNLLKSDILKLKNGENITVKSYDFKTGERFDSTDEGIFPGNIIIVEGLFVLHHDIYDIGDMNIFVDIGTHLKAGT